MNNWRMWGRNGEIAWHFGSIARMHDLQRKKMHGNRAKCVRVVSSANHFSHHFLMLQKNLMNASSRHFSRHFLKDFKVVPKIVGPKCLRWFLGLSTPLGTGCKLNVHKTLRGRPGRLLNVLCMFNLRPVSRATLFTKMHLWPCQTPMLAFF